MLFLFDLPSIDGFFFQIWAFFLVTWRLHVIMQDTPRRPPSQVENANQTYVFFVFGFNQVYVLGLYKRSSC